MKTFNNIYVPSVEDNVLFSEINTHQQLALSKALISSDVYKDEFIQTVMYLLKENLQNIPSSTIDTFDVHDMITILTGLHCISETDVVKIKITCKKCGNTYTVDVNLGNIYDKLKTLRSKTFKINDQINVKLPSIKKEIEYIKLSKKIMSDISISNKVQYIGIANIYRFTDIYLNHEDVFKYFDDLDDKILKNIIKSINEVSSMYNDTYIYKFNCVERCTSHYTKKISIETSKFYSYFNYMYNYNSMIGIYKDIYHLSKVGLDPSYINTISGFERNIYWGLYGKEIEKKKNILKGKKKNNL